jgi:hypothetical protein
MHDNMDVIAHLPMVFMGKNHQFFQLLTSFLQNLINTNKVELGLANLDDKHVKTAIKLASKFFKKMVDHIDKNSVPKEVYTFVKSLFVEQTSGGFAIALLSIVAPRSNPTVQPTTSKEGRKRKTNSDEPAVVVPGNKKPRKEFSDKSLKMGIFHVKAGTPVAKALPDKTLLTDSAGFCLDFCSQDKKCNFPHQLCKNGKHYINWKNVPNADKLILYKHMDSTGLNWFDAATFEKHKITIPSKYAHLLGDATGPNKST